VFVWSNYSSRYFELILNVSVAMNEQLQKDAALVMFGLRKKTKKKVNYLAVGTSKYRLLIKLLKSDLNSWKNYGTKSITSLFT